MVRQIISLHLGQAGLRSGAALWDLLLDEQGLNYEGFLRQDAFCGSLGPPTWVPPLKDAHLGVPGAPWVPSLIPGGLGGLGAPLGAPEATDRVPNAADTFFSETDTGKRVPRCVLLDLDYECRDTLLHSCLGGLFSPQCFVTGKEDGVLCMRSLGGGTGSGFGLIK
ncbi:RE44641p, related [Eimeria maxima]|uniref:RE44641p, related n=1 Tax=Eimeria maxima TaxID=5804 RepID=U6MD36_EIMMA|nr:RE44641p, related [Eimeria maxima]CDJ60379.1 RE44641p, related [Eimeria maxima]